MQKQLADKMVVSFCITRRNVKLNERKKKQQTSVSGSLVRILFPFVIYLRFHFSSISSSLYVSLFIPCNYFTQSFFKRTFYMPLFLFVNFTQLNEIFVHPFLSSHYLHLFFSIEHDF